MIAVRLSQLRKHKRWTLQYVADRLGIAKSTYAGYESGYREPSLEAVAQIATLFNTSVDYLVGHGASSNTLTLELTELLSDVPLQLEIDGQMLSKDEIIFIISWLKTTRALRNNR